MNYENYETSDFGLLIYLSINFPVIEVEKHNPRRAKFTFEKTPELLEAIEGYWNETALISPYKYFSQMKKIKSRLYENA